MTALVDRDALEPRKEPGQGLCLGRCAQGLDDWLEAGGELGAISPDLFQDPRCAPDEDARVPGEVSGSQESFGGRPVRLLAELANPVHRDAAASVEQLAALDVSIAGFGMGGLDAECDERARVVVHNRDRRLDRCQERLGGLDHVIGGHHDHRPRRVALDDDSRRQPYAGGRVAGRGLGNHVLGWQIGKLRPRGGGLIGARDDQDPLPRHQGLDPRDSLLEHRRLAGQSQQLLGPIAPALGPEPCPAAPRHDDRV